MLHSNPHSSHGFTLTLGIAILVFAGCAKKDSLGPELGSLFGDLELTAPFGHDMPNGVHFEQDEGVQFSGEFNLPVAYTLSLTGQASGASYSYQGQGENVADVLWYGDCDDVFFRQNEWVHCLLEFQDFPDDFQLDSVFVWEQPDLSSRGLLLASFEESQATYSLSSGEFTQSLDVLSEATDAVEGSAYMSGVGSGAAAWFGALRISLSPLAFGGLDPEKTHLNMHLRSNYVGSATVVKVFEDSDGDGLITAGMDEVYTTKLTLNADGNWHRRSVLWSDLELDLSGNNVSIDGQIDMDKIGRIDCTVSQTGTAEGTFGMDIDYVILTQDDPF